MNKTLNQESNQNTAGFFEGDDQNSSSVRLMSFMALVGAIIFGLLTVLNAGNSGSQGDSSGGLYITFGFLVAAFVPKAAQKFAENDLK
ncbi:hypothetical protein Xen7305DRAFT_00005580 [Xenococcus sp. PCC 7305]|uniref:hypothetical protein n=1 Tax=Xenococcus sp. PCC 7305 TaxID=102125 RepID=UPI0002ABBC11|nr:hypothetical protein [Xenococcus sp. PCC 7305]ELS00857.1 hypothetical protein Xen7305DRAFT_00005580 [Xenococcus sp. PCC 7305]